MFDLFVITYKSDYRLMSIFASSIDKFCQNLPINNIHVVNNCDEQMPILNFGSFDNKVKIYHYKDIYQGGLVDGYVRQQVLKLSAHKVCTADDIIILDAKNFFIKDVVTSDFIIDGKFHGCYSHPITEFTLPEYPIKKYAFDLFGISLETPTMSMNTPFLIKKHTLEELEIDLFKNFNLKLDSFFGNFVPAKTNEFYLMQAYIASKYNGLENYYYFTGDFSTGLWDSTLELINYNMNLETFFNSSYTDHKILISSIHPRTIKLMSPDIRQQLIDFWVKLGISTEKDARQIINDIVGK